MRLRALVGQPDDQVPIDFIVAEWMHEAATPAAQQAVALAPISDLTDPGAFGYPWAVLALFVNDAANSGASSGPTPPPTTDPGSTVAGGPSRTVHAPASTDDGGVCGALQSLYDDTVGAVIILARCGTAPSMAEYVLQRADNGLASLTYGKHMGFLHSDRARSGGAEAEDHSHRCGFAGAVRPEKPRHHTGFHCEREIVDGDFVTVSLRQMLGFDHVVTIPIGQSMVLATYPIGELVWRTAVIG